MSDKELSSLTAAGSLTGSTLYVVDSDGNSRKVSFAALKAAINETPLSSIPYRGARVRRTSDLSIVNGGSGSVIPWQVADINTDSIWNIATPTRLTVPAGVTRVRLHAGARFASNTAGSRQIFTSKGGAIFHGRISAVNNPASGGNDHNGSSAILNVSAGEFFELAAFQTSGGALNLTAGETTWFEMEIVEAS